MNERGISWAETMVSLFIVFSIFGTLLPAMHQMHVSLELKRERAGAYETLHEAAKEMSISGRMSGDRFHSGTLYHWEARDALCVSYDTYNNEQERVCIKK